MCMSDFLISLSPSKLSVMQGTENTVSVEITGALGFTDPVTLSLEGPLGIIGQGDDHIEPTFAPNPVNEGNSVLTLVVGQM